MSKMISALTSCFRVSRPRTRQSNIPTALPSATKTGNRDRTVNFFQRITRKKTPPKKISLPLEGYAEQAKKLRDMMNLDEAREASVREILEEEISVELLPSDKKEVPSVASADHESSEDDEVTFLISDMVRYWNLKNTGTKLGFPKKSVDKFGFPIEPNASLRIHEKKLVFHGQAGPEKKFVFYGQMGAVIKSNLAVATCKTKNEIIVELDDYMPENLNPQTEFLPLATTTLDESVPTEDNNDEDCFKDSDEDCQPLLESMYHQPDDSGLDDDDIMKYSLLE